jgi:hypothetical protein
MSWPCFTLILSLPSKQRVTGLSPAGNKVLFNTLRGANRFSLSSGQRCALGSDENIGVSYQYHVEEVFDLVSAIRTSRAA